MSDKEFEPQSDEQLPSNPVDDTDSQYTDTGEPVPEETELAFVAESASAGHSAGIFMLGILVIGGALIYFMRLHSIAIARGDSIESNSARDTINRFLIDGDKNIFAMRKLLDDTERYIKQFNIDNNRRQVPPEALKVNPFQFNAPRPDAPPEDAAKIAAREMQKAKDAALRDAQDFKLQMIVSGNNRSCTINNEFYAEGQEINGFTVAQITTGGVILTREIQVGDKHETLKFALKMKR